jgi:hypothetical protein
MKRNITSECNCKAFDNHFEFQHEQRKDVSITDKGSKVKYVYENKSSDFLSKYKVDGGLISDDGLKCDYLLLNCNRLRAYFIEIKGTDLIHAIEQIDRSIDLLKPAISKFAVFARIVLNRVSTPNFKSNPKYLRLEKKVKTLNGNLKQQSKVFSEQDI